MNHRIRRTSGLFLSAIFLCSISVCAYADTRQVIKSASEYDYPPFSVISRDGKAGGFSVELLREALSAVGLGVEFKTGKWDDLKKELAEGTIQVLPLVGRTPEREAIFDFTFPYITLHGAVFMRQGDRRVRTIGDLADKTVAVMRGDNAEEFVRRAKVTTRIIQVHSRRQCGRWMRGNAMRSSLSG
jgi:two-component system sensor histidine kinase EvgS